ncbi:MAG: hypothetical protein K9J06_02770 [Flavobacteriales bacterium]|nr:hypothetical protein [Flavobacteriales bacterium]
MAQHGLLIEKLDAFTRKYYLNQVIRGALLSTGLIVGLFVGLAVMEHFGHFGTGTRTVLFYAFVSVSLAALGLWVGLPAVRLRRIGPVISHDEAATIIGKHFPTIEDKLLNTLQLQRQAQTAGAGSELLLASIDQRTAELRPMPFVAAIDLRENRRFLRFALPPALVLLTLLIVAPSMVRDSTTRIVRHGTAFEDMAPFRFVVMNDGLETVALQDFPLSIRLEGDEVPSDLYIEVDGTRQMMVRENAALFTYVFRQPRESQTFQLYGGGFRSQGYELKVYPKPSVLAFEVELDYPTYTGSKMETRQNNGDLLIPTGTKVTWRFRTSETEQLHLLMDDSLHLPERTGKDGFSLSQRFRQSTAYTVLTSNNYLKHADSLRYTIGIIPDLYPSIAAEETPDSLNPKRLYFSGQIKDDYGFSALRFRYSVIRSGKGEEAVQEQELAVPKGRTSEDFYHFWDLGRMELAPGDVLEYWFEVWDNDGVNGSKSARTDKRTYRLPTLNELAEENDAKGEKMKDELSEAVKQAQKMQKELGKMQKDMLDKQQLTWEDKAKMQELIEMQKDLKKQVEQMKQENQQKNSKMSEFMEFDPALVEKQKQLEKLFDEVMSDEMKELFKKMEELMDELTKDKAQELLEDMKFSAEDLEKELDRSLELFKQLKFEQKLEQTKERMEELANEQDKLSEESLNKDSDKDELAEKQEELSKEFDGLKKDMDDLEKQNEELEKPNKMEDMADEKESVSEEQKEAEDQLQKDQKKKASESQKNAAKQMENMAQKMGEMMAQMQQESQSEDLDALRQIVDNLLTLSFDQEKLMLTLKGTNRNDPKYTELAREQLKLKDDSKLIEDSLYALSKRVPQIETVVNREIRSVNSNMGKAIGSMADRRTPEAASRQQQALTSVNNLALLLSEAIEQMQNAMAQASGSGSCKKPGKGNKPSAATMRSLQEQLNKQMEQMKKGMEKGGQEKGPKPGGNKPGQGGMGMSKEMAKMAAQQEALRQMVREYENELKKQGGGKGSGGDMDDLSRLMEQTETDIVNKQITRETMMRQQEILVKLLEAEKAEREREQEERRESREAKDEDYGNPEIYFEYKRRKNNETELLRTVPANLNPFYREKVDEYFKKQME